MATSSIGAELLTNITVSLTYWKQTIGNAHLVFYVTKKVHG